MKKVIKWGLLAVVLVLVIGVTGVYLKLNSIVKYVIVTQGTQQTNLQTALGGADVGLIGGEVELEQLQIANPPGFTAPHLFSMGELDVKAPFSQLRGNPKRISSITLDEPKMVIERSADGKFNFKQAIDQMPKPADPGKPQDPAAPGEEMKLIIDELTIADATVLVRPGINLPGVAQEITVKLPTITMKNIGNAEGAQNGAAMRDVLQQVITVMAANASNSNLLPDELRGLLNLDVNAVMAELGTRLGAEAQQRIAAAVPGELGAQLSKVIADPNALVKDPGQAVDVVKENLGKTLEEKGIPRNVDEVTKDPAKAAESLRGLFGNKKDKAKKPDAPAAENPSAPPAE